MTIPTKVEFLWAVRRGYNLRKWKPTSLLERVALQLLRSTAILMVFCWCSAVMVVPAGAQNLTGEIDGVVKDPTGALIPKASITVKNIDQNLTVRTVTSNDQGEFTAPLLGTGSYSLTVHATGFQTITETVEVHVGLHASATIQLQAGSLTQNVEVTANALQPQLDNAAAGTLISSEKITELPLSSRNFLQLLAIQPGISGGIPGPQDRGAISSAGTVNSANFSVNGLPAAQNGFFVDGEDFQRRSAGGTQIAAYPGIDFIQEINLQRSNYGAQFGGSGAAFVSINSKAGSTAFHGSIFEFYRSQALNANNYFNNFAGVPRPGLRYSDFGYSVGGPVWIPGITQRSTAKTFFFFGQEFLRSKSNSQETLTNVATAAQREGVFNVPVCVAYNAAGNCTSMSKTIASIDPTARAYLTDIINKTPVPNSPTDPQGLVVSESGINNETQTFIRIDRQITSKLSVFFRYLDDPFHLVVPNGLRQAQGVPGVGTANVTDGATIFFGHATYVIGSHNVLEGGGAHMQNWVTAQPIGYLQAANSPDIRPTLPYPTTLGRVPSLTINGLGFSTIGPYNNRDPLTQFFANDITTLGRHTISVGMNLEYQQAGNNFGQTNAGAYTFSPGVLTAGETNFDQAFANFLLGNVTNFQQNSSDTATLPHTNVYEAYVQDDFHATPRLTVNGGLRYSYIAQPTSGALVGFPLVPMVNFVPGLYNAASAPTLTSTGLICTAAPCTGGGTPNPAFSPTNGIIVGGKTSPYGEKVVQQPNLAFAPRFGFAYDASGDGRTSIRGGFGIYYFLIPNADQQAMAAQNYLNVVTTTIQNTNFASPGTGAVAGNPAPTVVHAEQVTAPNPYLESYSLDVQKELGKSTVLDIGYYGNHAVHLSITEDINAPLPGLFAQKGIISGNKVTASNTQTLNVIRPYQGYGPIDSIEQMFSSNYNSLQVSASRRFQHRSVVTVNYTYSKSLSNAFVPQNIYNPSAEYGPTAFDRRHLFNLNYVYSLPFFADQHGIEGHLLGGWEFSGIVSYGSGLFLTANTQAQDPAGQGILAVGSSEVGNGRPDYVSNANSGALRSQAQWFNKAAFSLVPATQYRPGTASNGSIQGPGYEVWDVTLFRNIEIFRESHLQLRGEAFNVFNHTNFSGIQTTLGTTNFGQVTSAGSARVLQLGAKMLF